MADELPAYLAGLTPETGPPPGFDDVPPAGEPRPRGAPGGAGTAPSLRFVWADDIALDLDSVDLVAELLPTQGLTVAYGPSGCGKTVFAVDLACHVASGLQWYGRAIEAGPVISVAAEAPASVEKRVTAWKWRHEVDQLDVAIVQAGVDL